MSASKAKAARKAADPDGYFKEPKRPTKKYQSKRDAQADRSEQARVERALLDVLFHGKGVENATGTENIEDQNAEDQR